MTSPLSSPFLNTLRTAHAYALEAAGELKSDGNTQSLGTLFLYFTLIELCGAVIALRDETLATGVASIARSALDAFVDIQNLLVDRNYWARLEMADDFEWKKLLESASGGTNPFLGPFSAAPNFFEMRSQIAARVKAAEKAGALKLSPEERFGKAHLDAEYRSLYAFLSAEAHNNTSMLWHRHIDPDTGALLLYRDGSGYSDAVLLTLAEMLMHVSEPIHARWSNAASAVSKIRSVVDAARAAVDNSGRSP